MSVAQLWRILWRLQDNLGRAAHKVHFAQRRCEAFLWRLLLPPSKLQSGFRDPLLPLN